MKNIIAVSIILLLSACGTIGIGSNHKVNIHNDSQSTIMAIGTNGSIKIHPDTVVTVESKDDISLKSNDKNCNSLIVSRQPNAAAIILDVVPGFIFGIIPILVDAVSNNLYKMPSNYYYQCD